MDRTASVTPAERGDRRSPNLTDVVFRLGTACFAVWVVIVVASSPTSDQRPAWWPAFVALGALIAVSMLIGGFMTLSFYLRRR
ncbi:MAG TPA: hypothetical protein VGH99_13655 [Pseudonocardia sp.]|jgi:hypothetical protein